MPFDSMAQMNAVVLLVPDVADPVTHKRVEALREAGYQVMVAGFHRGRFLSSPLPGGPHVVFGRTVDACYRHRLWALALALLRMMKVRGRLRSVGAIYARNLDQLALAVAIRVLLRPKAMSFYEALDIQPWHREEVSGRFYPLPGKMRTTMGGDANRLVIGLSLGVLQEASQLSRVVVSA